MADKSRKFLQSIVTRIGKSPILHNATSAIGNASGKAQFQLNNIQHVAAEKYDTIVKQVNGTMIIQDLNASALQKHAPIPKRLANWWRWYQQLTGMNDVELAQQHVITVQDKLFKCQDERRLLNHQASVIAERLKEIYGELVQTKRDDSKYVQLTIMENKSLQEQTRLASQMNLLENAERDHFTQLATAIKEYHDSQAMNAQKYKYLSIVASAALAIISLCGSMVYNNKRIRDVRTVIADAQRKNEETFQECFESLETMIAANFTKINEQLYKNEKSNVVRLKLANQETPQNAAGNPAITKKNRNDESPNEYSNILENYSNLTEVTKSMFTPITLAIGSAMLLLYVVGLR